MLSERFALWQSMATDQTRHEQRIWKMTEGCRKLGSTLWLLILLVDCLDLNIRAVSFSDAEHWIACSYSKRQWDFNRLVNQKTLFDVVASYCSGSLEDFVELSTAVVLR